MCVGEKELLGSWAARWAPDPVMNGVLTSVSRVFSPQANPFIYKAIYRGYFTPLITGRAHIVGPNFQKTSLVLKHPGNIHVRSNFKGG